MGSQAAGPPSGAPLESEVFAGELLAPSERDRLLAAMATCCAERGYRAVSVEEVAARAGLDRGTFEENFADKEACGLAAVNQILAEATTVVTAAYSPRYPEWEVILRAARALLELLAAQPSLATLAYVESRQAMPAEARELYASGIRVLVALLDRVRVHAVGSDAPLPPSATRGAIGGAEALIRRELRAGRGDRLPELLPDIVYGLLVPYLDQPGALRYAGLARELLKEAGR